MHTLVHVCLEGRRGRQITAAGVRGGSEIPDLGVESQAWTVCESSNCS